MSRLFNWVTISMLAGLIILQVVFWNDQRMPVLIPLCTLLALGLSSACFPALSEWKTRLVFATGFGCVFLLVWARFQVQFNLQHSRLWLVTIVLLLALLAFLIYVDRAVTKRNKIPISLIMVVSFAFGVAMLSGDRGGQGHTFQWLIDIFGIHPDLAGKINGWIRKSVHFLAYGFAAYLTAHAVERQKGTLSMSIVAGLAWPLPLAIFDEWNQSRHPSRGASLWDVVLDLTGMVVLLAFYAWRRQSRELKEASL